MFDLLCKGSLSRMFKPRNNFIHFLLNEHLALLTQLFYCSTSTCHVLFYIFVLIQFSIWNCNILKLTLKSSAYFFKTATFLIYITHENSLFQCLPHTSYMKTHFSTVCLTWHNLIQEVMWLVECLCLIRAAQWFIGMTLKNVTSTDSLSVKAKPSVSLAWVAKIFLE